MKIIFLHIPKAGGTTLHNIFERLYPTSEVFTIKGNREHGLDAFKTLSEEEKAKIQVLKGHMPFGLHSYFKEEIKYITLFRNPVNRVVSHYEYVLRKPKHYLYERVKGSNMTLEDYALSDLSTELDNHQCRSFLDVDDIEINRFNEIAFDRVLQNLKKHSVTFGLVEEFDASLLLFRQELGWSQYPYYVKLNTNPDNRKIDVPQELANKIAARNRWDVRLYEYAKSEFSRRLQSIPELQGQLEALRVASEAYKKGLEEGMRGHQGGNTFNVKRLVRSLFRR